MSEGSGTAAECNGLNLGDFGCLEAGDIGLGLIIALAPSLFGLWMKLLGGKTWRSRVGLWLYDASWSTAYAGLLQKLLVRLRWFFGRPWSRRALDMCFRLAVVYAVAYLYFGNWLTWEGGATVKWTFAGIGPVLGAMSFLIARSVRRRHLRARRRAESRKRRIWLHLREQLAYVAVAVAVAAAAAAAVLAFILTIIPVLNALFDWLSWAVSRWLMGRLRADATRPGIFRRAGALLAHLAIDGAVAIACLFGLAIVLINMAHAIDAPELWDDTLIAAKEAPFSARGSTMTVMLLSTLVPTALHLFFALFALAAIRPPYREWFGVWLEESKGGGEWGNRAIVSAYLTFWMVFALAVLWGAAMALIHGLDWLWLRLGWGLETDLYPFWASIFRAAEAFVIF